MNATKINGLLLKKMMIAGANALNEQKQYVDSLNVFPVPDGDTGTNMSLTALAAARETEKSDSLSVGEIARLASNGALRGARGNSGVITSQLFRGFAKALDGLNDANVNDLARAARKAVQTAYKAVMKPKEGTILTVARACADSAEKVALETENVENFLERVIEDANAILLQTTEMLPVLKQAGVVDAGGQGLLYILKGAYEHMQHPQDVHVASPSKATVTDFGALNSIANDSITFGYCTEFFINVHQSSDTVVQNLKSYLSTIGDSLICVNDDEVIKIHVHTDHPGLVIEKALSLGSLSGLKIDNMREQHASKIEFGSNLQTQENPENKPTRKKDVGFIAISSGAGLSQIFKNLGADEVIEGGQTMNPSTEDILNSIEKVNADTIFVLPNNKNIILAAEQSAKLTADKKVLVVPSKTVPEGISAMFSYDKEISPEEALEAMKESMATITTASVTYAVRDTSLDGRKIKKDDILGMIGDNITVVAHDVFEGTKELIDSVITENSDVVSLYYGADVTEEDAQKMAKYVEEKFPSCEVEVQCGNQPLYFYVISVE